MFLQQLIKHSNYIIVLQFECAIRHCFYFVADVNISFELLGIESFNISYNTNFFNFSVDVP